MPKKSDHLQSLIEQFTTDLATAIAAQIHEQVAAAVARLSPGDFRAGAGASAASGKLDGRRSGRICPVPNCGKPGAGPRNRWFCKDHASKLSVAEQQGILERNRRLAADGKLPPSVPEQRVVRLPAKEKRPTRTLDMSCRVEGCPNRSRGPRAGFICDQHRAQLSREEQLAARELWNARHKGAARAAEAVQVPKPAVLPVPPIVRKAEAVE